MLVYSINAINIYIYLFKFYEETMALAVFAYSSVQTKRV